MARPPLARERVLDAYEALLIDDGERAATMDAVAAAAGVSKGGLLYHFPSKAAMESAYIERMLRLADEDIASLRSAPDGPVAAFIRTSAATGDPLDRALTAVGRMAAGNSEPASTAMRDLRARWYSFLGEHITDEASLRLVMLVADGVWFNTTLDIGSAEDLGDIGAVIALVEASIRS